MRVDQMRVCRSGSKAASNFEPATRKSSLLSELARSGEREKGIRFRGEFLECWVQRYWLRRIARFPEVTPGVPVLTLENRERPDPSPYARLTPMLRGIGWLATRSTRYCGAKCGGPTRI